MYNVKIHKIHSDRLILNVILSSLFGLNVIIFCNTPFSSVMCYSISKCFDVKQRRTLV